MGRTGYVADVHLGNHQRAGGPVHSGINGRCQLILNSLQLATIRAAEQRCDRMVVCGDLFDGSCPSPQLVAAAQKVVREGRADDLSIRMTPRVWIMRGNHDMESAAEDDDALGPLKPVASLVRKPTELDGLTLFPFVVGDTLQAIDAEGRKMSMSRPMRAAMEGRRTLAIHAGVRDEKTAHFLQDASDSVPLRALVRVMGQQGFDLCVAGNWHDRRVWTEPAAIAGQRPFTVVQIGALVPTGWDNQGLEYGGLLVVDDDTGEYEIHEVPGPRFAVCRTEEEADRFILACHAKQCLPFLEFRVPPGVTFERYPKSEGRTHRGPAGLAPDMNVGHISYATDERALAARAAEVGRDLRKASGMEEAVRTFIRTSIEWNYREKVEERALAILSSVSPDRGFGGSESLRVRELTLDGFYGHEGSRVALPRTGLVVVRGENGAGKTALLEAPSYAVWGKTLRGNKPWSRTRNGELGARLGSSVEDGIEVSRTWKLGPRGGEPKEACVWGGVPSVEEVQASEAAAEFGTTTTRHPTKTKATAGLEDRFGAHSAWRWSCVLRSRDAAHFTNGTDGDRKRFLEQVIGLDRFDVAGERAKEQRVLAVSACDEADALVKAARVTRDATRASLVLAERILEQVIGEEPPPFDRAKLERQIAELDRLARKADEEATNYGHRRGAAEQEKGQAVRECDAAQRQLDAAKHRGVCPTCGAASSAELVELLANKLADKAAARDVAWAKAKCLDGEWAAADEEVSEANALRYKAVDKRDELSKHEAARASWEKQVAAMAEARRVVDVLREKEAAETKAAQAHEESWAEFEEIRLASTMVERLLGRQGVRVALFDQALAAIEQVANAWLPRLGRSDISVRLASTTVTEKTGQPAEKLSVVIEGAGEGEYRGASDGEQRRIDLAILRGVQELAGGRWVEPPTLWFDEVFDALDARGKESVGEALRELAEDRCVVVITHDDTIAANLRADLRLFVQAGKVTEERA